MFPEGQRVAVVEVGPRDGLQSLGRWIPTEQKIAMVDRLSEAGFPAIEVTGFAHPKVIPELSDAEEVLAGIAKRPGTEYRALVPNARGAQRATQTDVDSVVGLLAVSETYCEKNQNMSVAEAIAQAAEACAIATDAGLGFHLAVAIAFECPYEGRVPEANTMKVLAQLDEAGINDVYLADSLGTADPRHVHDLFAAAIAEWPEANFGFHVHNLAGFGMANIVAAVSAGATSVEGSICGIGGGIVMPDAVGSLGNVATEDIVHLLNELGAATGLDSAAVLAASREIAADLEIVPASYLFHCGDMIGL